MYVQNVSLKTELCTEGNEPRNTAMEVITAHAKHLTAHWQMLAD